MHGAIPASRADALRGCLVTVPDTGRERILAEKDLARLERWLELAIIAISVADGVPPNEAIQPTEARADSYTAGAAFFHVNPTMARSATPRGIRGAGCAA
jgi:hypothetical protein